MGPRTKGNCCLAAAAPGPVCSGDAWTSSFPKRTMPGGARSCGRAGLGTYIPRFGPPGVCSEGLGVWEVWESGKRPCHSAILSEIEALRLGSRGKDEFKSAEGMTSCDPNRSQSVLGSHPPLNAEHQKLMLLALPSTLNPKSKKP